MMNNKILLTVFVLSALVIYSCKNQPAPAYRQTGSVERLSPLMDDIIEPGVLPEILADSFDWSEGPVWVPGLNMLLFSDIPQNSVFQWTAKDGLKLYLKPSGYTDTIPRGGETGSNGLLLDPEGRLVLCQHGDRRMARMDAPLDKPEPRFVTLADRWNGKRFNSPNDAVCSSKGVLYFTDPAFGMEFRWEDPKREMDFAGVFRLGTDGEVSLLIDSLSAPNGIALSPDESTLYVSVSGSDARWYAYQLSDDGSLAGGKVFYDAREMKKDRPGSADGMVVRRDGIIFATGPGGVFVFDPEGNHLGTVLTGQRTSNCTLDAEGGWLYMTADMFLMRIKLR
jgi:gluconolactonase